MGKEYPKFSEVPLKVLYDASQECYKNSARYLKESKLLLKRSSYGHSLGLSALGIEELS